MDRRSFFRNSIFTVLGLGLGSIPSLASSPTRVSSRLSIALPTANEHVRHGLFQQSLTPISTGPEWLNGFRLDRFYQNGFERSEKDLMNLSLGLNGESFSFFISEESIEISTESDSQMLAFPKSDNPVSAESGGFLFEVHNVTRPSALPVNQAGEQIALAIKGAAYLNDMSLSQSHAVYLEGHTRLVVEPKGPLILLLAAPL